MTANYNLLDEKWIPVLYRDGRYKRVGIRKVLEEAGRIRQIAATNPMDRVATLRFLLALLYWCKGNPAGDVGAGLEVSFSPRWFEKLERNKACFNLLGEEERFCQDSTAQRTRATTDLIQEIPTGNNFWHFRHSTDIRDGLCPACCALGLLRLPLFSVSGLPDLRAGINGTPPIYVVPLGASLLKTLVANWTPCQAVGEPSWVKSWVPEIEGEDIPLLAGLTMLSRRIWLHALEPEGTCIGCGLRGTPIVRTCEFQTAGRQENDKWADPHLVYLDKTPRKAMKAHDLSAAGKFRMDRPWLHLLTRLVETGRIGSDEKGESLLIVGFATDKAKNIDVWERRLMVPSGASIRDTAVSLLQQWTKQGANIEKRTVRSKAEGSALVAAIRPHVEDAVSIQIAQLIAGNDQAWQRAADEYRPMMTMIAQSVSPGFTTAAVHRRHQIASVAPEMRTKPRPVKKPKPRKGGGR